LIVQGVSFHVNEGSLVCILGPSGCGKTTLLRAIAGFESLWDGRVLLQAQIVSRAGFSLPPEQRRVGMVFQENALFPHLNVLDNVAFGLRSRDSRESRSKALEMLDAVGLAGLEERYPHELSWGQQQRVSLARAVAPHPQLLLLDEPFSSLDGELRERLGRELRELLRQQRITGILVTHDQNEAFALADQVGVMNEGRLLQWDSAHNLYHEPSSRFVADFIGQGSFLRGTLITPDTVQTEVGLLRGNRAYALPEGSAVDVLLRPDDVRPSGGGNGAVAVQITAKAFKGAEVLYSLRLPTGTTILSLFPSRQDYPLGAEVRVRIDPDHLVAFPV
jgi:iron(III) transport system ATP-binding protein